MGFFREGLNLLHRSLRIEKCMDGIALNPHLSQWLCKKNIKALKSREGVERT